MNRHLHHNILYAAVAILWGLLILGACAGDEHQKMLAHLEELERQNLADSVMTNDSLAERLAEYFDHHGTPNERMRAHYILGRTYADLGEAPAALNAYLDAVECADTTAVDCKYRTLSRTYGQMADVFYRQNLMQDYLKACDKSICYAWVAKDTLQALGESAMKVAGYNRLEQYDSVISVFDEVFDDLVQYYGIEMAAQYTMLPISALLERDQIEKCRYYFDIAERESGYFDSANNIQKGREVYYYYKGRYFLKTHQCDSAEYYFRKEMRTGSDVINQSMASRGLSLTFDKMHIPDSSAKYALYSYEMLDSVYSQMSTDEVAHISALYNYSRHQANAHREHIRADQEKAQKEHLIIIMAVLLTIVGLIWILLARKHRQEAEKYRKNVRELSQVSRRLRDLEKQKAIFESLANKEITQKSAEVAAIHHQNEELERQIQEANDTLIQLRNEVMRIHFDKILTNRDIDTLLEESPIYKQLKMKSTRCETLKSGEWLAIEKLVKEVLPGFYNLVTSRQSSLRQEGRRLCFLLRLHIGLKEAGVLMGVNQPKISKLSRHILMNVFQEEGSGKELIKRLEDIS